MYGVPDIAVFVKRTGRGILTNHVGYFSLPVLSGDTVSIKGMGFMERKIIVPDTALDMSVFIKLESDTFMLPEVLLWPFPTYESFKEAFLAYEPASPHEDYAKKNLDQKTLRMIMYNTDATASMNYKYSIYQQANKQQYRYQVPTLTLLNPFAWARFIKDVKSGGLKNKKWEDIDKWENEDEK